MLLLILFILLFIFMFMGIPVAVSLGTSTIITAFLFSEMDLAAIPQKIFTGLDHYSLMAIPMFILAGSFLKQGSSSKRIVEFAKAIVGHLPGGLAISAIFASIIFAAVSGSSPATVVAIGSIMYAAIKDAGYPKSYAIGTIVTSGSLGILIPPSIVMIVYGVTAEESVGKLFIAGVIPGLMIGLMLMFVTYLGAIRLGFKSSKPASFKVRLTKFKEAFWALMLIVIVIGGIYSGIFTPTEAGAIGAVYAFFVSFFVYKDIKVKDIYKIALEASSTTAMILFIIANAMIFSHFLTAQSIPQEITKLISNLNINYIVFLMIVNILLLLMGDFMEPTSVIMITVPLLLPIAKHFGIDPIHFGIIMVINMEIGMITPPVGLNLFVGSAITNLSLKDVLMASLPWTFTIFIGLILVTYIPQISLFLPNLMYK